MSERRRSLFSSAAGQDRMVSSRWKSYEMFGVSNRAYLVEEGLFFIGGPNNDQAV